VRLCATPAEKLFLRGPLIVIDTSALIAISLGEPSRERLLDALETAADRVLSAMSILEAGIVLRARLGESAVGLLYQLVDHLVSEVAPFDGIQPRLAIAAFGRFGKGMDHRPRLNFGDCAVYALAVSRGEPVLATGSVFAATDLPCYRL
jgi:ribonuclease VapC